MRKADLFSQLFSKSPLNRPSLLKTDHIANTGSPRGVVEPTAISTLLVVKPASRLSEFKYTVLFYVNEGK